MQTKPPDAKTTLILARLQVSRLKDIEHRSRERLERLTRIQVDLEENLHKQGRAKQFDDLLARHRQLDSDMSGFTEDFEQACDDLERDCQTGLAASA